MTERYLGSIITANPVEPSANTENSAASGVWNIHDPLIFGQASDWPDPSVPSPDKFVENLFSCFAYTGTGSARTITNNIDLANNGGLVWIKSRSASGDNSLFDTERLSDDGSGRVINTNNDLASRDFDAEFPGVSSTGFGPISGVYNTSGDTYISWTFRKQPKFFDVVTYTGTGSTQTINHNLGSVPGCIIIKRTSSTEDWNFYHRGYTDGGNPTFGKLNLTDAFSANTSVFNNTFPTSSVFTVDSNNIVNTSGQTYVAYLFAHNDGDGGFGANGDQDIIKCGSYNGNGSSSNEIDLGFEAQWVLIKSAAGTNAGNENYGIYDSTRGIVAKSTYATDRQLRPNSNASEQLYDYIKTSPKGFTLEDNDASVNASGVTYIYVAIRRGPMQTPTVATSVFDVQRYTGDSSQNRKFTTNFVVDSNITSGVSSVNYSTCWGARVFDGMLQTHTTANTYYDLNTWIGYDHNDGFIAGEGANYSYQNASGQTYVSYSFSRAPKFFDVVAYIGTGSNQTIKHNLNAAPEIILTKRLNSARNWAFTTNFSSSAYTLAYLNDGYAPGASGSSYDTGMTAQPSSTEFFVGSSADTNDSGDGYVAYLFATLAGISKVGTYSGTGSDVNVDCGFTSGARFVVAKRLDSSGDWYIWDSESGIIAGNDPYHLFNSDAAQVTNTDYIDPLSSGFTITSNAGSDLNASGGTYTFLAIA